MKNLKLIIFLFIGFQLIFLQKNQGQTNVKNATIDNIQQFCSSRKGFNLLGKFDVNWSNNGFKEKEFQVMQELGFNFARLPIDYRTYTLTQNWNYFVESRVNNIDQAIAWGEKYNVHVCLNLHRAPGYCVNSSTLPANQNLDLWTDTTAQKVFVNHWKFFAERYRDISPAVLSFNLVNEPKDIAEEDYVKVMKMAIDAIHEISPNRIIFVDGLNYARNIVLSLKDEPNIAQAIHSYDPFQLTHYKASWVSGSDTWPVPKWPMLMISNYLYGSWKNEFKSPLVFQGNFPAGTKVMVNVHQVSAEATLQIKAGSTTVYSKKFVCSANPGDDFTKIVETQWGYQNISDKDFSVHLTNETAQLSFENTVGDWMTINSISLVIGSDSVSYVLSDNSWGKKQSTYLIDENYTVKTQDGNDLFPLEDYKSSFTMAEENNILYMVQEFGVHNQTPHQVAVNFLDDLSSFFAANNVGWALWNLDGSFGILNSGRSDCSYEPFNGYQLDKKMLDALLKWPTANQNLKNQQQFHVFPTPANNNINISGSFPKGEINLNLFDVSGKKMKSKIQSAENKNLIQFDVSDLKSGLYLLKIAGDNLNFAQKILIE